MFAKKCVFIGLNFIIWVLGAAIFSIGLWIRVDPNFWYYQDTLTISNYYAASYIIMAVGLLLLIISFVGCCGTASDSPIMMLLFIIGMSIMLIMELAAVGLAFKNVNREKLKDFLTTQIKGKIPDLKDSSNDRLRDALTILQIALKCCGGESQEDYVEADLPIPNSCMSPDTGSVYQYGCGENLTRALVMRSGLIGGIGIGLVLVQVAALIIAICLYREMRADSTGHGEKVDRKFGRFIRPPHRNVSPEPQAAELRKEPMLSAEQEKVDPNVDTMV